MKYVDERISTYLFWKKVPGFSNGVVLRNHPVRHYLITNSRKNNEKPTGKLSIHIDVFRSTVPNFCPQNEQNATLPTFIYVKTDRRPNNSHFCCSCLSKCELFSSELCNWKDLQKGASLLLLMPCNYPKKRRRVPCAIKRNTRHYD